MKKVYKCSMIWKVDILESADKIVTVKQDYVTDNLAAFLDITSLHVAAFCNLVVLGAWGRGEVGGGGGEFHCTQ